MATLVTSPSPALDLAPRRLSRARPEMYPLLGREEPRIPSEADRALEKLEAERTRLYAAVFQEVGVKAGIPDLQKNDPRIASLPRKLIVKLSNDIEQINIQLMKIGSGS